MMVLARKGSGCVWLMHPGCVLLSCTLSLRERAPGLLGARPRRPINPV